MSRSAPEHAPKLAGDPAATNEHCTVGGPVVTSDATMVPDLGRARSEGLAIRARHGQQGRRRVNREVTHCRRAVDVPGRVHGPDLGETITRRPPDHWLYQSPAPEQAGNAVAVVPAGYSRHWKVDPASVAEKPKVTVGAVTTLPAPGPLVSDISGSVAPTLKSRVAGAGSMFAGSSPSDLEPVATVGQAGVGDWTRPERSRGRTCRVEPPAQERRPDLRGREAEVAERTRQLRPRDAGGRSVGSVA